MNKLFKISKLLSLLLFLYSCGSVGEALQGKKRSDQGDEFLVEKKNPLVMPPDYGKLPQPDTGQSSNAGRMIVQSQFQLNFKLNILQTLTTFYPLFSVGLWC